MDWLGRIRGWARSITDLGIVAVALVVVLQILFGGGGVPFFGLDPISGITGIVSSLGSQGLVGLVALGALYWCFTKD